MLFRMIRGALFRQKSKMLLIAVTIALGASLATGMLNVMMNVSDSLKEELTTYGANITVKSKDSSLLADIYSMENMGGDSLQNGYLREDELGKLKTIFWAFNIKDFAPFLETTEKLPSGDTGHVVGTWFNHHLSLSTGEELDAGVTSLRDWWDITSGEWINEQDENAVNQIMAGSAVAQQEGWQVGDAVQIAVGNERRDVTVKGIFESGDDTDNQIYAPLDLVQNLTNRENKVSTI